MNGPSILLVSQYTVRALRIGRSMALKVFWGSVEPGAFQACRLAAMICLDPDECLLQLHR